MVRIKVEAVLPMLASEYQVELHLPAFRALLSRVRTPRREAAKSAQPAQASPALCSAAAHTAAGPCTLRAECAGSWPRSAALWVLS